jgi:DNA-binding winged helix-turn-helix (wHTH) protein
LLREGEPVPLAPKGLEILHVLIENRGRVLTKDELLKQVWNRLRTERKHFVDTHQDDRLPC